MKIFYTACIFSYLISLNPEAVAATSCYATASDLVFGNISMGSAANSSASVSIECNTFDLSLLATARVRMCLNLGAGLASGSTINLRSMNTLALVPLQFQIYRDAALTQVLGDTPVDDIDIDLEYSVPILGGSGTKNLSIYGYVPPQLNLAAASYFSVFSGGHTRLDYRYAERLLGTPSWPASCTSGGNGGGSIIFPFNATATVAASCVIDIANNLNFGSISGLINSHHDHTTDVSFTCTKNTPWSLSLDHGLHYTSERRMRNNATGQFVSYQLYRDSGRTLPWGDTPGIDTVNGSGSGSSQTQTVYGRVSAPQSVASGNYSDTITVTITY
ncbi:Csu type fimbrial protein [Gilvimarinus sp. 1_MG-2023]|uniref:Csu type fimbrial protein n=1 Tax=Gilvimarinus sp. 1_MG-2023 TaxID=3062638 RepID=UPI0026E33F3E|nr:spore coat U domain-containing protein [Gilvimarinus sp. 1_MG-2023]MDO6748540.1 spore coat U domain-containing protein [Gilvimarinus sp. 1_MG-2023]